ncbi:hypothetical protein [uncultured Sphingomonas sp.]|uniref:hypothetical protein n=1 Tax=uncultured Sphingomonas sp. TaxID=158754 RepID=UPI002599F606|nr:hypothetical protein [uncultured Sphingomonas sp.]
MISDVNDAALVAAWISMREAMAELRANGVAATEEQDAPANAKYEAADDVIFDTPASGGAGARVKLSRALMIMNHDGWVWDALMDGDTAVLVTRAAELDGPERLVVMAIAALPVGIDPQGRLARGLRL